MGVTHWVASRMRWGSAGNVVTTRRWSVWGSRSSLPNKAITDTVIVRNLSCSATTVMPAEEEQWTASAVFSTRMDCVWSVLVTMPISPSTSVRTATLPCTLSTPSSPSQSSSSSSSTTSTPPTPCPIMSTSTYQTRIRKSIHSLSSNSMSTTSTSYSSSSTISPSSIPSQTYSSSTISHSLFLTLPIISHSLIVTINN